MDVQIVSGLFDMFGIEGNNGNPSHGQPQNHGQNSSPTNNGKYQGPYKTEDDDFTDHVGNVTGAMRGTNSGPQQLHVNGGGHRTHGRNANGMGNGLPPLHGVSRKDES